MTDKTRKILSVIVAVLLFVVVAFTTFVNLVPMSIFAAYEYPETVIDEYGNEWVLVNSVTGQYQFGTYLAWNDYYKEYRETPNYAHYVDTDGDGIPDLILPLEDNYLSTEFYINYNSNNSDVGMSISLGYSDSYYIVCGVAYDETKQLYGVGFCVGPSPYTISAEFPTNAEAQSYLQAFFASSIVYEHPTYAKIGDCKFKVLGGPRYYTQMDTLANNTNSLGNTRVIIGYIPSLLSGSSEPSTPTITIDKSPIYSDYQGYPDLSLAFDSSSAVDYSNWWFTNYSNHARTSNSGYENLYPNLQLPVGLNIWKPASDTSIPVYKLGNMNYAYYHYYTDSNQSYKFDTVFFTELAEDVTLPATNNAYNNWQASVVENGIITKLVSTSTRDIVVPAGSVAITVLDSAQSGTGVVCGYIGTDGAFYTRPTGIVSTFSPDDNANVRTTFSLFQNQPCLAWEFSSMPTYWRSYDMTLSLSGSNTYTAKEESYANQVMNTFLKLNAYTSEDLAHYITSINDQINLIDGEYDKGFDDGLHTSLWTDLFVAPLKTIYELPFITLNLGSGNTLNLTWGNIFSVLIAFSLVLTFLKLYAGG